MKNLDRYNKKLVNSISYLDNLKKENNFEYSPSLSGVTENGKKLNLGFSTYALKILYMTNKLDTKTEFKKDKWAEYINSYQCDIEKLPKNSFVDHTLLNYYMKSNLKDSLKYGAKYLISYLPSKNYDTKKDALRKAINAETKQAISSLYQIGYSNKNKIYIDENPETTLDYLSKLDWSKPWSAGGQFSSYCVYSQTQGVDLSNELTHFLNSIVDKQTGSYFTEKPKTSREIINGAMKVISGLDWLDEEIHYPKQLIDFCLKNKPVSEGCDIVDFVYVLFKCSQQTNYKKKEVNILMTNVLEKLSLLYHPDESGFSYYKEKSQTHYYGVQITKGENKADIHGTLLCIWAIIMIMKSNELDDNKYNLIKP